MKRLLLPLWLVGAVLYSTPLLINSIWSSDDDDPKLIAENVTSTPPAVAKVEPVETAPTQPDQFEPIDPAAAETPHAIKVEQTPSAAPAWPIPVSPQEQPRPSVETTWASANPAELLKATSAASIGAAYAAARVQVAARDSGWTQIVDSSTGNRGWIDSALLAPLTPAIDTA